ncbi:MAG: GyrI-like domain-containing protein [Bacteroidia bacterium]|nr:GyrI-like domain-containing protein [Bacteroidia bacterium]
MKHEWRKKEKTFYLPKNRPERITIPEFGFYTISGTGNPNSEKFGEYLSALYSVTYAIRMSPKKKLAPKNYVEYTVYPLEGVWDFTEQGRKEYQEGNFNKDEFAFTLMIRQPDFVTEEFALEMLEHTKKAKSNELLEKVRFETIADGDCVQMLHLGPYDEEPASFKIMEDFTEAEGLIRSHKTHREIYISDVRRTAPEKLKTVLRFKVKEA